MAIERRAPHMPSAFSPEAFRVAAEHKGFNANDINLLLSYAERLVGQGLPVIFDDEHLSKLVGYDVRLLYAITNSPRSFYRTFHIPKRGGGVRTINEPLPALKVIQQWVGTHVGTALPVSQACKAYVQGSSIKDNARLHKGQEIVLNVDIDDFFSSCKISTISRALLKVGYSKRVVGLICGLVTREGGLPMGSPSSPSLANYIMNEFDEEMLEYCRGRGLRFSRYSDDITISGHFDVSSLLIKLRAELQRHGFRLNQRKTKVLRKNRRQVVTGIVVNEFMNVPRYQRRRLRQEAYYISKFGIDEHLYRTGNQRPDWANALLARAGYNVWVNPNDGVSAAARDALLKVRRERAD